MDHPVFSAKSRLAVLALIGGVAVVFLPLGHGFSSQHHHHRLPCRLHPCSRIILKTGLEDNDEIKGATRSTSRYADSVSASKGIVSTLTNLVNSISSSFSSSSKPADQCTDVPSTITASVAASSSSSSPPPPPRSPLELLERIRQDYTVKNYLWTGDIDMACFDKQCKFTDPTLSFTGTDQFVQNIQNLKPIVDRLIPQEEEQGEENTGGEPSRRRPCSSVLLDIQLMEQEGYIQTRWNMIGDLKLLPWKPRIDVIGRTKFWFKESTIATTTPEEKQDGAAVAYQVVDYDEEWEIPAGKALLQLVTPAGTIPNSSAKS